MFDYAKYIQRLENYLVQIGGYFQGQKVRQPDITNKSMDQIQLHRYSVLSPPVSEKTPQTVLLSFHMQVTHVPMLPHQ